MPNDPNKNQTDGAVQTLDEIEAAGLEAIEAANAGEDDDAAAAAAAAAGADDKGGAAAGEKKDGDGDGGQVVYTEEFDLGNGQKATFEGKTPEELRENIIKGYRELAAGKKPEGAQPTAAATATTTGKEGAAAATAAAPAAPVKKGRKLTSDEEFALNHEFRKEGGNPLKAMRDWLQIEGGMTFEELQEAVETNRTIKKVERERQAVVAFRAKHPEYPPMTDSSVDLVRRYLDGRGEEATVETLEAAYSHFGNILVPVKPADDKGAQPAATTGAGAPAAGGKTTAAAATTTRKPAGSGLWGKTGAPQPKSGAGDGKKKPMSDAEMTKIAKEEGSDALLARLEEQHKAGVNA